MEKIEQKLIGLFGYHEELMEINGVKFWGIYDSSHNSVGYIEYDEDSGVYHTRINSPAIYLDAERHKSSKEIKCEAKVRKSKTETQIKKLVID
jgi:hypothetical protein